MVTSYQVYQLSIRRKKRWTSNLLSHSTNSMSGIIHVYTDNFFYGYTDNILAYASQQSMTYLYSSKKTIWWWWYVAPHPLMLTCGASLRLPPPIASDPSFPWKSHAVVGHRWGAQHGSTPLSVLAHPATLRPISHLWKATPQAARAGPNPFPLPQS